jgi:tyrosinase
MAAVRRNVVTDETARKSFIDGVLALKADHLGPTTADIGISGPARPLSTYDLFIVWHHLAMGRMTPPTQRDRNAAHSGPAFLPWHRLMLLLFELQLQRVLDDVTVGLPYWDWAADGDRSPAQKTQAPLWHDTTGIGGTGTPVTGGPFQPSDFRVEIDSGPTGQLRTTNRGLSRTLGIDTDRLPTTNDVIAVLGDSTYDLSPWNRSSLGFRNRVEGWRPNGPRLHNRVHVWVGGDMAPATSPNDPVFYLNHCNVDRIWEAWMVRHGRTYAPPTTAPAELAGHRLGDRLYSVLITQPFTPADVLDASAFASYDQLP